MRVFIPNYSGTAFYKIARAEGLFVINSGSGGQTQTYKGCTWRNTAAITRLSVFPNSGVWDVGTYFGLYGMP